MFLLRSAIRSTLTRGPLLLLALLPMTRALLAQQLSLGAGSTRMEGQLGDAQSDHGIAVRLGVDLLTRTHLTGAFEGVMERLNEAHRQSTDNCILPGGGTGPCFFDSRSRDTGWSLGTTLRIAPGDGPVGVGVLTVRQRQQQQVTDDAGNILTNFSFDGTFHAEALQGHLGAGITSRPAGWPVALHAEGRMTRVFHNDSGGLVGNWNPTFVVGVRR